MMALDADVKLIFGLEVSSIATPIGPAASAGGSAGEASTTADITSLVGRETVATTGGCHFIVPKSAFQGRRDF